MIATTPLSPILGSIVHGVTPAELLREDATALAAALRALIAERLVLLLERQSLTPPQFVAFARLFGALPDRKPESHVEGADDIKLVSNRGDAAGGRGGAGSAAALIWHADDTYRPEPPSFMFLHARVVPPGRRPRTAWLSAYALHDRLDPAMRGALGGRRAIHAAIGSNDVAQHLRGALPVAMRAEGAHHPLLRAHPDSGRPALFMPRRRDALVAGLDEADSAALVGPLWDAVMQADHGCSVALDAGDLVVWDNRFTLHAREAWDPGAERTLWRLANTGEPPLPA